MKAGIELITEERQRQVEVEGWTANHDDKHTNGQLAVAAAAYALGRSTIGSTKTYTGMEMEFGLYPWSEWTAPPGAGDKVIQEKTRLRQLVIAGALILAEIDRLQRLEGDK